MLVCFTVCGWCWSQVASQSRGLAYCSPVAPPTGALAVSGQQRPLRNGTKNIEDVRMGERLVGRNPLRDQTQSPSNITPETHRSVRLEMDAYGVTYELAFTRSLDWIDQTHAVVGHEIDLVMHEMGLNGKARVIAIDPCPKIEPDDGTGRMIVTGTMKHLASNVLSLDITGQAEPLGVTDTHPIWSEDRQAFVVAGQLQRGERLRQLNGTLTQVTRITPMRGPPVNVYNLEIDGEHVYHVTTNGLLVHNACPWDKMAVGEHALQDKHNWSKLFGDTRPTLQTIQPHIDDVLTNGTWRKVGNATGKGKVVIGEILEAQHNGVWVRGFRDLMGNIIVNNAGAL